MKKYLFFLLLSQFCFSQNDHKIDSLLTILQKTNSNYNKAKLYFELSSFTQNNDSTYTFLTQSLKYARLSKSYQYIYKSRTKIAALKETKYNPDSLKQELNQLSLEIKNSKIQTANLQYEYAEIQKKKSNYDSAHYFVNEGLTLAKQIKNPYVIARGYMILGNYAFTKYEYEDSYKYYSKCDSICERNDSLKVSSFRAKVYNYLGYAVRKPYGYDKALGYYLQSKQLYQKVKDYAGEQEINIGLAQLYANENKYAEALPLLNEAAAYHKSYKTKSYGYSLITRGYLLIKMKNFTAAKKDYQAYYDLAFKGEDDVLKKKATGYMAYFFRMNKEYEKSEEYYQKALSMYGKEYDYNKFLLYEELIELYEETQDYKKLSLTYQEYIALRDILDEEDKNKGIYELETKYQTEKKEQEIKLLSALSTKQNYIYLSILGLLIAIGGFLFYGYRNKIKTAQKLNELNELKSRFFANISHEFRTPLTLIKSPVQSLQNEIKDESQKSKLELIDKNSNRMLELVDQLLELSKIDSGNLKLILKEGNITSFLNSMIEPFQFQAKEHKLLFNATIEKNADNHHFDKDVIEKIATNLLSNAFKYTAANEKVSFTSKIESNQLQLVVSNSGSEIKKEEVFKLFERFYQEKESQQGVGIGLALVKELVELYNGKIETSVENGILSFTVLLPLEKANANGIVVSKEMSNPIIAEKDTNETELPILLLVDDNQDIRAVLKDIFKEDFQIFEAEDGEQGLKMAKKEIPDCIISDIMMPKMDGFEFTKQLKSNELTSFIPIILLTAKTSEQAHLEGLQSAADAFLRKPFNNEIVKTAVFQLISERKKLQERYSQELVLKPVDIVIDSIEEKFIEKLQVILDKELANADFSAEDFATAVGMSRMQLHRKLKSLLGVSATEFLRNERLKVAAELLIKNNGNISEIIYAVGFNDTSYFIRCFKEKYNCTPSEYQEKNK